MILGTRLKRLRQELGFSQEALGAQGFVSTPGWIKIENGQRSASEKLIDNLVSWLVTDKHIRITAAKGLGEELRLLKYADHPSAFVRRMAEGWAEGKPWAAALLAEAAATKSHKPKRGRPPMKATTGRRAK